MLLPKSSRLSSHPAMIAPLVAQNAQVFGNDRHRRRAGYVQPIPEILESSQVEGVGAVTVLGEVHRKNAGLWVAFAQGQIKIVQVAGALEHFRSEERRVGNEL